MLIDKKDNMTPQAEFREGLDELAVHYKEVLKLLGEDPTREGLEKTPIRVAKGYASANTRLHTRSKEGFDRRSIRRKVQSNGHC